MFVPSMFERSFADDLFDNMFSMPSFSWEKTPASYGMTADVKEYDDKYLLELEIPGYRKEDISAELKNGYLCITANHTEDKDEKDENGKYIRRERYTGTCQRSFYVGKQITEQDIRASFENGMLKLTIPMKEAQPAVPEKHLIAIEG